MARAKSDTPVLEWIVGAIGAGAFLVLVGAAIWSAATSTNAPPAIAIRIERIIETPRGYAVEIEATNEGDITAAGLTFKATLTRNGAIVEEHALEFDYLARHSARRGGFLFEDDPRLGELKVSADGYTDP